MDSDEEVISEQESILSEDDDRLMDAEMKDEEKKEEPAVR